MTTCKTSTDRMRDFADACYGDNNRTGLLEALNHDPDQADMDTWQISDGQWRKAEDANE